MPFAVSAVAVYGSDLVRQRGGESRDVDGTGTDALRSQVLQRGRAPLPARNRALWILLRVGVLANPPVASEQEDSTRGGAMKCMLRLWNYDFCGKPM